MERLQKSSSNLPTFHSTILPMKIYGLDFTSAPRRRKPITCALCTLADTRLHFKSLCSLPNFTEFEEFLRQPGPWIAGFDFPFGQPRELVQNLNWPDSWEGYVQKISTLSKLGFVQLLTAYCHAQRPGEKHHLRATDKKARSRSPMMLYGVPVGKMFFEGAPRLLKTGVSILPCYPTDDSRICIEVYPKLVAQKYLVRSYKSDTRAKQTTAQQTARRDLINFLRSNGLRVSYGFSVELSDTMAEDIIHDASGDQLDAVLCAIQAGWAYGQREHNYGIPPDCDPLEGWIVDPSLL